MTTFLRSAAGMTGSFSTGGFAAGGGPGRNGSFSMNGRTALTASSKRLSSKRGAPGRARQRGTERDRRRETVPRQSSRNLHVRRDLGNERWCHQPGTAVGRGGSRIGRRRRRLSRHIKHLLATRAAYFLAGDVIGE